MKKRVTLLLLALLALAVLFLAGCAPWGYPGGHGHGRGYGYGYGMYGGGCVYQGE